MKDEIRTIGIRGWEQTQETYKTLAVCHSLGSVQKFMQS